MNDDNRFEDLDDYDYFYKRGSYAKDYHSGQMSHHKLRNKFKDLIAVIFWFAGLLVLKACWPLGVMFIAISIVMGIS